MYSGIDNNPNDSSRLYTTLLPSGSVSICLILRCFPLLIESTVLKIIFNATLLT